MVLTADIADASGGALGWKPKGSFDPKFEEVAFALDPSTTSNPKIGEAKTEFGYHIIMVSTLPPTIYMVKVATDAFHRLRVANRWHQIRINQRKSTLSHCFANR